MNEWLNKNYFVNTKGETDIIVDSLGDCILQSVYLIGKNCIDISDFYVAFLNETTVMFGVDDKGDFKLLHNLKNVYGKNIFEMHEYKDINENASEKITEILNKNKAAMIHPIIERFPFAEAYDPTYTGTSFRSLHYFLIIAEDENNYYFVDNPAIVVKKNFVPYESNPQVGLLSKELFNRVTKDKCDVIDVTFDENKIIEANFNWKTSFYNSYVNYRKTCEKVNGLYIEYGKKALLKLKNYFEEEKINIRDIAPSNDRSMVKYFLWRIWILIGRRNLQLQYLQNHNINNSIELIDALNGSIACWENFKIYLMKAERLSNKSTKEIVLPSLNKLISAEDKLNEAYEQFLY